MEYNEFEHIDIPEGLEQRLSQTIDEWERAEQCQQRSRTLRRTVITAVSAAACVALAFAIGSHFHSQELPDETAAIAQNKGEQDTYTDPDQAYAEAEKALQLLAYNINKGLNHLNQ